MSPAAALLRRLRAAGAEFSAVPGGLRLSCQTPLPPELHALVAQHRTELRAMLLNVAPIDGWAFTGADLAERAGDAPARCAPADPLEEDRAAPGRLVVVRLQGGAATGCVVPLLQSIQARRRALVARAGATKGLMLLDVPPARPLGPGAARGATDVSPVL